MKPSVILYESLPADLLSRLNEQYQVTEISALNAETVADMPMSFVRQSDCSVPAEKLIKPCSTVCPH